MTYLIKYQHLNIKKLCFKFINQSQNFNPESGLIPKISYKKSQLYKSLVAVHQLFVKIFLLMGDFV